MQAPTDSVFLIHRQRNEAAQIAQILRPSPLSSRGNPAGLNGALLKTQHYVIPEGLADGRQVPLLLWPVLEKRNRRAISLRDPRLDVQVSAWDAKC